MVIKRELIYSVCDSRKSITIWNRRSGEIIETVDTTNATLSCISFGAEGELLSGDNDGLVQIWKKQVRKKRHQK